MLLLVDAGNTRVKWALAESVAHGAAVAGRWQACDALFHRDLDRLGEAWRGVVIERAVVSNVAGPEMRQKIERALCAAPAAQPVAVEWFASVAQAGGVCNGYRDPAQLGCDRFASAIGAHALFPGEPLVIATCGTATTIDAVSPDGEFVGGMILPGLGLMASSLARNTAQLPQVGQQLRIAQAFADNTDDAIVSGCVAAQAGAIERAMTAFGAHYRNAQCLLSGGAGAMLAPHLSMPCRVVENLVLVGLHAWMIQEQSC
jgi:type III pantothenate kinase